MNLPNDRLGLIERTRKVLTAGSCTGLAGTARSSKTFPRMGTGGTVQRAQGHKKIASVQALSTL
jgi:hypothetical protein